MPSLNPVCILQDKQSLCQLRKDLLGCCWGDDGVLVAFSLNTDFCHPGTGASIYLYQAIFAVGVDCHSVLGVDMPRYLSQCFSYFSIVATKHHDQGSL